MLKPRRRHLLIHFKCYSMQRITKTKKSNAVKTHWSQTRRLYYAVRSIERFDRRIGREPRIRFEGRPAPTSTNIP